ncbi:hypothetical protein D3OALGA1CA_4760 [Olavius algarvensis associated proteobacterium Delta 3]|nr:hypothetical protein D3OALGA1CA_4760 [Olavius algarvensis associated proteobacterium Delta 3]
MCQTASELKVDLSAFIYKKLAKVSRIIHDSGYFSSILDMCVIKIKGFFHGL